VGGDDAAPVGLDLPAEGPGALVAGPPGGGRSTALHTAALHHLGRGMPVAVVAAGRSPLVDLAGIPGVLGMFGPDDGPELRAAVAGAPASVLIVVDDADQLLDTSVDATLEQLLADGRCGILAAGVTDDLHATYRGFTVPLRRSRTGLVLCPRGPTDGDLLGVKLTRGLATRPGRGILIRRGRPTPIQVALPSTPEPVPP
jgi:S-DNA-T family DNA segregation ATPase FtsK/SpoIIIE